MRVAEIKNSTLCWDNVLRSINIANEHPEVDSMLTVVIDASMDVPVRLERVHDILSPCPNVRLKVNNVRENPETAVRGLASCDADELAADLCAYVDMHPEYAGRVIYEPSGAAVTDYSALMFF